MPAKYTLKRELRSGLDRVEHHDGDGAEDEDGEPCGEEGADGFAAEGKEEEGHGKDDRGDGDAVHHVLDQARRFAGQQERDADQEHDDVHHRLRETKVHDFVERGFVHLHGICGEVADLAAGKIVDSLSLDDQVELLRGDAGLVDHDRDGSGDLFCGIDVEHVVDLHDVVHDPVFGGFAGRDRPYGVVGYDDDKPADWR